MPTTVTTSATTLTVKTQQLTPAAVYVVEERAKSTYQVEPHAPTAR